jgi:Uma2 family endonuclease
MSTVTTISITNLAQLDPDGVYNYADYLTWKFKERVELIRGHLFPMSPGPNVAHQRILGNLHVPMWHFFHTHTCQVFMAPFDVRLPLNKEEKQSTTVVQPDICVVCDPQKIDEQGCNGAPDLVVEILSPGNSKREMREKFQIYEEAGVREYWLVYPIDEEVRVYVMNELGKFVGLAPVIVDDVMQSAIFPGLQIDLKQVFEQR